MTNPRRILFTSQQPNSLQYQPGLSFELRIEGVRNGNPDTAEYPDIIKVGIIGNDFFRFGSMTVGVGSNPKSANWTADGVEIIYESGERVFLPKGYMHDSR